MVGLVSIASRQPNIKLLADLNIVNCLWVDIKKHLEEYKILESTSVNTQKAGLAHSWHSLCKIKAMWKKKYGNFVNR